MEIKKYKIKKTGEVVEGVVVGDLNLLLCRKAGFFREEYEPYTEPELEYDWHTVRNKLAFNRRYWAVGHNMFFVEYDKDVKEICELAMKHKAIKMWQNVCNQQPGYDDVVCIYRRLDR